MQTQPILARFRNVYEQSTIPLGRYCLRLGLTPNTLTMISLIVGAAAAFAIAKQQYWWGVALILLMGFADMLDGATARAGNLASSFGTVLDHVIDRYAEFFLLTGVLLSGSVQAVWVIFALFGMVMASYVRARAESTDILRSCNVGFAGRQEKLTLLGIGLILHPILLPLAILEWCVIAIGIVSHITAIQRLLYTYRLSNTTH
jgi:phosphatidylglycerophosphate synthase